MLLLVVIHLHFGLLCAECGNSVTWSVVGHIKSKLTSAWQPFSWTSGWLWHHVPWEHQSVGNGSRLPCAAIAQSQCCRSCCCCCSCSCWSTFRGSDTVTVITVCVCTWCLQRGRRWGAALRRPAGATYYGRKYQRFLHPTAGTAIAHLSHRSSVCLYVRHTGGSVKNGVQARITITNLSLLAAWKTLVSGTVNLFHKFEKGHS